jgi:hypothetical protein
MVPEGNFRLITFLFPLVAEAIVEKTDPSLPGRTACQRRKDVSLLAVKAIT